jgi:hypothetical protein
LNFIEKMTSTVEHVQNLVRKEKEEFHTAIQSTRASVSAALSQTTLTASSSPYSPCLAKYQVGTLFLVIGALVFTLWRKRGQSLLYSQVQSHEIVFELQDASNPEAPNSQPAMDHANKLSAV